MTRSAAIYVYLLSAAILVFAAGCATAGAGPKAGAGSREQGSGASGGLRIEEPEARGEKRPLVLVHYMPWFQAPPIAAGYGFHWHQGGAVFDPFATLPDGRANIASNYYPLTGPYDSRDGKALEYQAALMKMSGIDGVVFDWYGIDEALDYGPIHESTLAMIAVLKAAGLAYAICYEDQSIGRMIEAKHLTRDGALAAAKKTFDWLQENWFADEAYAKLDGRPVVLCFGPQYFKDAAQWNEILSVDGPRPWLVCLDDQGSAVADGSYDWPPMWASEGGALSRDRLVSYLNGFYERQSAKPHLVATAFPGFFDIYQKAGSGRSYGFLDYAEGATFELTLGAAMRARPDIIQIATWNDYGEGTVVEPTIEHGYRELEVLQDLRRRFEADFPYDYSDLRAPIELFKARQSAAGGADRRKSIGAVYDAIFANSPDAYRAALAAAKIKTDFGVSPYLRERAAPSAALDPSLAVFDPAGRENLAFRMPIVYTSNIYAFTGDKAVDGDLSSYWEGAANSYPDSLTVDLVSSRRLGTAVLKLNPKRIWGPRTQRIEVLSSEDGKEFVPLAPERDYPFDPAANGNAVAIPLGVAARYLRLVFSGNSGAGAGQLAELEIYGE